MGYPSADYIGYGGSGKYGHPHYPPFFTTSPMLLAQPLFPLPRQARIARGVYVCEEPVIRTYEYCHHQYEPNARKNLHSYDRSRDGEKNHNKNHANGNIQKHHAPASASQDKISNKHGDDNDIKRRNRHPDTWSNTPFVNERTKPADSSKFPASQQHENKDKRPPAYAPRDHDRHMLPGGPAHRHGHRVHETPSKHEHTKHPSGSVMHDNHDTKDTVTNFLRHNVELLQDKHGVWHECIRAADVNRAWRAERRGQKNRG